MSSMVASMSMNFEDQVYADTKFVNLDPGLNCVVCKEWLKNPYQLSCGHRICFACIGKLFVEPHSDTSKRFPCPSGDEDCEPSARDEVHPDPSALKDLKRSKVFCTYQQYGCKEQPSLAKLKEHVENCQYVKNCPHCKQRLPPAQIDEHIATVCREAPVECQFKCNVSKMSRWQMEEHYRDCPQKPQRCKYYAMGCHVELVKADMLAHDKDHETHLQILVKHIEEMERGSNQLYTKLQAVLSELATLRQQLAQLIQEKDLLNNKILSLKDSQRATEERNAALSSKFVKCEAELRECESQVLELNDMKTRCGQLETSLRQLPSSQQQTAAVGLPEDVRKKFISHDRTIGLHDLRLSEFDLRLQCAETANYEGVLIWKIGEYEDRKRQAVQGRVLSLYSQPFYTSRYGYKMCARAYLNGDGAGKNTHLSLFFVVMQGDYDEILTWQFRQRVTLSLLDQVNNRRAISDTFSPDPTSSSFQKPTSPMNVASGCPKFVPHSTLESPNEPYLRNNTLFIKVVVNTSDLLPP